MSKSTATTTAASSLRITESRNELTTDIDVIDSNGIIRVLRNCDAQLFSGYREYENIFEIKDMDNVINVLVDVYNTNGVVFVSGAGTSGRLAHFVCCNFNKYLISQEKKPIFYHLIAGGEAALLKSQESAEDASVAAVKDFERARKAADVPIGGKSVLIGVTCGFSATYVGAQIEHILDNLSNDDDGWSAVALGFNPVELVRNIQVAGWNATFKHILNRLLNENNGYVLSPTVGPEGITGSTRMKGGSGTKIILESLLISAFKVLQTKDSIKNNNHLNRDNNINNNNNENTKIFNEIVLNYQKTMNETYRLSFIDGQLGKIIDKAGKALRKQKRVIYLSEDIVFGTLGVIDASECPPTYGASFDDVRAFLKGGWTTLMKNVICENPTPGIGDGDELLKSMHMDHFEQAILPTLTQNDLIIVLFHNYDFMNILDVSSRLVYVCGQAKKQHVELCCVHIYDKMMPTSEDSLSAKTLAFEECNFFANVEIPLHKLPSLENSSITPYREFACKLILNAISTGAHVLKGTTVSNLMVSLKISNAKLFDRATNLLQRLVGGEEGLPVETAQMWILKAIYGNKSHSTIVADHIVEAMSIEEPIVPLAYLMVKAGMARTDAMNALKVKSARKVILDYGKM